MTTDAPELHPHQASQDGGTSDDAVLAALDRIVKSKAFAESPRLRTLLEFIVKRTLDGAHGDLKEAVIGIEIFGKSHDFDPRVDSAVRVAANRLRARLRAYYDFEGAGDPLVITLPEGHYRAEFVPNEVRPAGSGIRRSNNRTGVRAFVGRRAEFDFLRNRLNQAVEGRGGILCVVAEPGIGKTALIEQFLETAERETSLLSATGRCRQELEHTEPYLAWLEILEDLASGDPAVGNLLRATAPTWWNNLHFRKQEPHLQQASSVKREICRFLQALTDSRLLVLVLEDVHWADASTIDLVSYLGPVLPSLRLLLIVSYRASDLALLESPFRKIEPELKMHGVCEDLVLGTLSLADAEQYLDLRFPHHTFPSELVEHLQHRSEGNALCLTAMVDYAVARGWLTDPTGPWELTIPLERWAMEIPPSVRSMVVVKLAALSHADRELLSAAAVHGTNFNARVLARTLGLDETFVEDRLTALERTYRLLRGTGNLRLSAGTTRGYRFAHILYQEALLNAVEPARRERLCSRLGEAIIAFHGDGNPAIIANVARLLQEAGAGEPVLRYYSQAAGHAVQLSAYRHALDLASRAAAIARQCNPSKDVRRYEIEFLTVQALALASLEGFAASEIEGVYRRASEIARELEDFTAIASIAHIHWDLVSTISLDTALQLAHTLLQNAGAAENAEAGALARMAQGITLFHRGALFSGTAALRQAAEQWRRLDGPLAFRAYTLDPSVATQCNLARALWFIGRPDRAWKTALAAVELAFRIGHNRTTAYAFSVVADIAHLRRDPAGTFEWSEKTIALASEYELGYEMAWARILQGWALGETGELAQAGAILERAAHYRGPCATKALCHFAEILGRQGACEQALAVLDDAVQIADGRGERYYMSELQRVRGEITLRSGGSAIASSAEKLLRRAIRTARKSGAMSCELRAANSLARFSLEYRFGASNQALKNLASVVSRLPRDAESPDLAEARALLRQAA